MSSIPIIIAVAAGWCCIQPVRSELTLQDSMLYLRQLANTHIDERSALQHSVQAVLYEAGVGSTSVGQGVLLNLLTPNVHAQDVTGNDTCFADLAFLGQKLINATNWSLQMVDSIGKPPSGILQGNLKWLGYMDQCFNVTREATGRFDAQYCTVTLGYKSKQSPLSAITVTIGICLPLSCKSKVIEKRFFSSSFDNGKNGSTEGFGVLATSCPAKSVPLTTEAIVVIVLLSIFAVLLIAGTAYDLLWHQRHLRESKKLALSVDDSEPSSSQNEIPESLHVGPYTPILGSCATQANSTGGGEMGVLGKSLLAFSIYSNGKKLLSTTQSEASLACVHGVRFLSMSWVILGHTYGFSAMFVSNPTAVLQWIKRFTFQALMGATVSVDSFFLLSGLLVSYLTLNKLHTSGKVNWLLFYFHRFWRLTPPYMMVMAMYTTLLPYLGHGPTYFQETDANCKKNWWQNLLYINNLFKNTGECMAWAWYLANDMQFFIFSPIFIYILYRNGRVGTVLVAAGVVGNLIIRGVISRVHQFGAAAAGNAKAFNVMYQVPWTRYGPYLVGIYFGYLLHRHHVERKFRNMHWIINSVGWGLAVTCGMCSVYGLYNVYQGHPLSVDVAALYNATFRVAWALALGWLVFACCTGHGGFINTLLAWPGMVTLSRLTYMAYLVHPIVIFYYLLSRQSPIYADDMTPVWLFLGNMTVSYGFAFILSLAFESPMIGLEKALLGRFM